MRIVETAIFTRQVVATLSDETYRALQAALVNRPELGKVIPGSGGLRNARWGAPGRGKPGGVRIIYYWAVRRDTILMLFLYPKNVQAELSDDQVRTLRARLSMRSIHEQGKGAAPKRSLQRDRHPDTPRHE